MVLVRLLPSTMACTVVPLRRAIEDKVSPSATSYQIPPGRGLTGAAVGARDDCGCRPQPPVPASSRPAEPVMISRRRVNGSVMGAQGGGSPCQRNHILVMFRQESALRTRCFSSANKPHVVVARGGPAVRRVPTASPNEYHRHKRDQKFIEYFPLHYTLSRSSPDMQKKPSFRSLSLSAASTTAATFPSASRFVAPLPDTSRRFPATSSPSLASVRGCLIPGVLHG